MEIEFSVTVDVPVFFTVTACAALVCPFTVIGKATGDGVSVTDPVVVEPPQACTRLVAFTEPRPVARSNPVPVLYPEITPYVSPLCETVQFGDPLAQGTLLLPEVTS